MIWYVRRRDDDSISSAHQEMQPGYAEEALDDQTDADLIAFLAAARTLPRRARHEALEEALIAKGIISKADVDAKEPRGVRG